MTQHYGTQVINKSNSLEMQALASFLGSIGILNKDAFLSQYTTTLDHSIYTPFTIGTPTTYWELWDQIVVCAHEHEHVVESNRLGIITYDFRYVTDTASRASYEAEAYRSALELNWWASKTLPNIPKLAAMLSGYGCSNTDIKVAQTILTSASVSIQRGAILNPATSIALGWLNAHAEYLRAEGLSDTYLEPKCVCNVCTI